MVLQRKKVVATAPKLVSSHAEVDESAYQGQDQLPAGNSSLHTIQDQPSDRVVGKPLGNVTNSLIK